MRRYGLMLLAMVLMHGLAGAQGVGEVDVLDYDLRLDLSEGAPFAGEAVLTVRMAEECATFGLNLIGTVDSLWVDDVRVEAADLGRVPVRGHAVGDTLRVRVCYHGRGYVESYGWGGFHFDEDMSYNLGVAFDTDPHVIGRAMFPCRDNFTDKATYTLRVRTRSGWTAQCGGMLQSRAVDADGTEHTVWRIDQPVPTYLVSVSQADFHVIELVCHSLYGDYPVSLGYTTHDSAAVRQAFALLDSVVPMYERCFGPYRWGRIGYIATRQGSMEHVNNIGLLSDFMTGTTPNGQSTIAHELGHAWFGNLITCSDEGDMWINEGGASFCSEVALEATSGRESSNFHYQRTLESVVRSAHIGDGGYRALHDMPHTNTYGSTTYNKGALVWHSLRGYLGEDLFYSCMRRLMASAAFGNLDAMQLRDSLSLYSGVDLTDFFRFHVQTPGFVDYHLGSLEQVEGGVRLAVEQQGVGTTEWVRSNRVPVTFCAADGRQAKRWITFSGRDTTVVVGDLPFAAAYCLLDSECELSDAATIEQNPASSAGTHTFMNSHMEVKVPQGAQSEGTVWVEHHYGRPYGLDTLPGVVRTARRYWVVNGQWGAGAIEGRFQFCRGGITSNSYPYLDLGFYVRQQSLDSIALLYRPDTRSAWRMVSRRHTGTFNDGHFVVDRLRTGEYALAVVDTALLSVVGAAGDEGLHSLFPNPLPHGEALVVEVPGADIFDIAIVDMNGRQVWQKQGCSSGAPLRPGLVAGTYLVQIKNNFLSLQSILIQL